MSNHILESKARAVWDCREKLNDVLMETAGYFSVVVRQCKVLTDRRGELKCDLADTEARLRIAEAERETVDALGKEIVGRLDQLERGK